MNVIVHAQSKKNFFAQIYPQICVIICLLSYSFCLMAFLPVRSNVSFANDQKFSKDGPKNLELSSTTNLKFLSRNQIVS